MKGANAMSGWAEGIQRALEYIERTLTEPLDVEAVAAQAHVSAFHFQRIFSALCGITVGEYVRSRRLTLAAQELSATDEKVIDVALKYGYDSPDSFARAFARFHGVAPSNAKNSGVSLRSFAPLKIKLTLESGNMLEYKIVAKPAFTVTGLARRFDMETSYREIPKFWKEIFSADEKPPVCGALGVCIGDGGREFEYLIAENYIPWKDVPEGCVTRAISQSEWAVFPCRGALPNALQSVNTKIWNEWLPSLSGYELAGNYNIEYYAPPAAKPEDAYSEIWIPMKKK